MSKKYKITVRLSVKGGFVGTGTECQTITKARAEQCGISAGEFDALIDRGVFKLLVDSTDKDVIQMSNKRLASVIDAIASLDESDKNDFSDDGIPKISAIKLLVGGNISVAERDFAFQKFMESKK